LLLLLELLFAREGAFSCPVLSSHDIDELIDFICISRCELNNNNNNKMCKESPTGFMLSSFAITLLRDEAWLHLLMSPVVDERLRPVHG